MRSTPAGPRPGHFTFYPRSKLYGAFDDLLAVRDLTERLMALGCADERVQILAGEEGVRSLDRDGRHQAVMARLVRSLQAITDERAHIEIYVHELLLGRYVVAVSLSGKHMYEPLCQAFKQAGGHAVHYYGPFVTEQVSV